MCSLQIPEDFRKTYQELWVCHLLRDLINVVTLHSHLTWSASWSAECFQTIQKNLMSPKGPNGLETDLKAQRCEEGQALGHICLGENRGWVSGDAETMMLLSALSFFQQQREKS